MAVWVGDVAAAVKFEVKLPIWNRDEAQNEQFQHEALVRYKFPLFMNWVVFVESLVISWVEDVAMVFVNYFVFPSTLSLEVPIAPLNL